MTRVVDADDVTLGVDQRAARVTAADTSVVLEDLVDRRPTRLAARGRRADDAAGEGVVDLVDRVRVAGRVTGGVDLEPGGHLAVEVRQRRVAVAVELDHREVGTFADAEDLGVDGFVLTGHRDLQQRSAGDDVVVRDDDSVVGDDRPTADTGGVALFADLGVDERSFGQDLDDGLLDIGDVEAVASVVGDSVESVVASVSVASVVVSTSEMESLDDESSPPPQEATATAPTASNTTMRFMGPPQGSMSVSTLLTATWRARDERPVPGRGRMKFSVARRCPSSGRR